MASIVKHILINIMEKKLRTVIVILTILLATAIIFIGLSLNNIINDTYTTMLKGAYGNSNIMITKDDDSPFYETADLDTGNVSVNEQNDMITAAGKSNLNGENVKVSLTGMDYNKALQMELIAPIRTADHFTLEKDSAIISQKTATDYGLDIGDSIKVTVNDKPYNYTIGAISETNGIYYSEMSHLLLVVAPEQVNGIYGIKNKRSSTLLAVSNENLDQTIDQLVSDNMGFSIQKSDAAMSNDRDEETFLFTMITAITIIVLISAYVILSLSKIIISERMPVVGTFRSIGSSKRMINRILGLEFLVYGIIGAILGISIAFALLPPIADIFNEYKEFGLETKVNYSIGYAGLAFAFGMFFPVCVGMIHVVGINRKPLKEIILNTTQTAQKRSILPAVLGFILLIGSFVLYAINTMDQLLYGALSILLLIVSMILLVPILLNLISKGLGMLFGRTANGEMTLGIKNIGNNKIVANNCSMMIIVLLLLMMVGMTTKGLNDYLSDSIEIDDDISINNLDKDPSFYKNVKQVDGVSGYRVDYISAANYRIKGESEQFGMIGVKDFKAFDKDTAGITLIGDAKEQIKKAPDGVLIDVYQAKRYGLGTGDTIQLQPLDAQGESLNGKNDYLNVVVAGVIDSYGNGTGRSTALLNLNYFKKHFDGVYNQISVKVSPGYDMEQVKKDISELFIDSNITVMTFDEKLADQKATIDTLISGITVIILMGMIIGLLGITNNLIVSFLQRKQEYAVLYSVSMSRWQLVKMQWYEMMTTFIAVAVIGFIGGVFMNIILEKLLYSLGLRIELGFDFGLYGILCGVVFIILVLSSLATVRKVMKMNMLKELRYE